MKLNNNIDMRYYSNNTTLFNHNPMFPEPKPSLADVMDKHQDSMKKDNASSKAIDVLADHGGKIALLAFGLAAYLIYTYYQGINDRNSIEDDIENKRLIEPYEILELRYSNSMSTDIYNTIVTTLKQHCSDSISYRDFVILMKSNDTLGKISRNFKSMYLLDRVVQGLVQVNNNGADSNNNNNSTVQSWMDVPLSLDLLLVLINLLMVEFAYDRVLGLFHLASIIDNNNSNEQSVTVSRDTLVKIVEHLASTDQIPAAKQVIPNGVKYPIKRHRRKTPDEMVSEYEENPKIKIKLDRVDVDTFNKVLTSTHVCAWGECYRGRHN